MKKLLILFLMFSPLTFAGKALSKKELKVEEMLSLHDSAEQGDIQKLQELLEKGINVNMRDSAKRTALHKAIQNGRQDEAELLLIYGADPNARDHRGLTPLHAAVWVRRPGAVRLLINRGANPEIKTSEQGVTALQLAEERFDYPEIAEYLKRINPGLSFNKSPPNKAMLKELTEKQAESLHYSDRHINIYSLNRKLKSSPHDLARYGDIHTLQDFLKQGMDPNARNKDLLSVTALHLSIGDGRSDTSEILLNYGADINAQDSLGWTPFHWAVAKRRPNMLRFLFQKGANHEIKNKKGLTPLMLAEKLGYEDIVEYLKEKPTRQLSACAKSFKKQ